MAKPKTKRKALRCRYCKGPMTPEEKMMNFGACSKSGCRHKSFCDHI